MSSLLLTRDQFREAVFARDRHRCVFCYRKLAEGHRLDAHHIIERRLWPDGGYYVANGATVCENHHLACEKTNISVEQVREACGITKPVLPPDFYDDVRYDKWGNTILEDGRRTRGPLFDDPSVQKILAQGGVLEDFTYLVKYPRTWHLPWSPGVSKDDRVLRDCRLFEGRRVVVTRKMDGENFTGYQDYCHARSLDGRSHPSRDWAKAYWAERGWQLAEGWRVCAENLYAEHSLRYEDLPSYLLGFSVWDETNTCLGWDDTTEWFALLDMAMVEVLYDGLWNEAVIRSLYDERTDWGVHEGFVVRLADAFAFRDFSRSVAKLVRANHVRTTKHWMHGQRIVPNGLRKGGA